MPSLKPKTPADFSWLAIGGYVAVLSLFAIFSYSLTDPNLVLTSWNPYWQFQQWLWRTFFDNSVLLSQAFTLLITCLLGSYIFLLPQLRGIAARPSRVGLTLAMVAVPCLLAYNAMSHDVFNYIFNAKMVTQHQANPHVQVALDFADDPWVRFMHNTHTPAPYGYGWTALSLIPFGLGLGKFLSTWIVFKIFSLLGLGLLIWVWCREVKSRAIASHERWLMVALHPLVLLEVVSNAHNDIWMLLPAVLALGLVAQNPPTRKWVALTFLLLVLSISIKLVTVVLLPIWIGLLLTRFKIKGLEPLQQIVRNYWPLLASMALFVPLLTARSQQFHPWYLLWVLVWLPWFKLGQNTFFNTLQSGWQLWVLGLSLASLYRYIPWLLEGGFNDQVITEQKLITWLGGLIAALFLFGLQRRWRRFQALTAFQE